VFTITIVILTSNLIFLLHNRLTREGFSAYSGIKNCLTADNKYNIQNNINMGILY